MFELGSDYFEKEYNASMVKCQIWSDQTTSNVAKHHGISLQSIRGVYGWHKSISEIKNLIDAGQANATTPMLFHYVSKEQMYEIHSYWNMKKPNVLMRSFGANALSDKAEISAHTYDAEVSEYIRYANSCIYSKGDASRQKAKPDCDL